MIQKNTMYIISSSKRTLLKEILSEKLSLLFGNFEVVEVVGFDYPTSKSFLAERLKGWSIEKDVIGYILDITNGNPFYLDVICSGLKEKAVSSQKNNINTNELEEILVKVLFNSDGTIHQYYNNVISYLLENKSRASYLPILCALSSGANTIQKLKNHLAKKSSSLGTKLDHLCKMDMVVKNGMFFTIEDRLFELWLRIVYNQKHTLLLDDMHEKEKYFRNEFRNDMETFKQENKKNINERIKALLTSFNGEKVKLERKTKILPKFLKIETLHFEKSVEGFRCAKENGYWIFSYKDAVVNESDIAQFIDTKLNKKDKINRKIFIALGGIEAGALLLAKEKKVWIWDTDKLNRLLRFYGKRSVIS